MDTGGVTVFAVILIILIVVFVAITNFFVPFYKKIELINIATEYYSRMEVAGGMTPQEATNLNDTLAAKGFYNINIVKTDKGTASYGQPLRLEITSLYNINTFGVSLNVQSWVTPVDMTHKIEKLYKRIEE